MLFASAILFSQEALAGRGDLGNASQARLQRIVD
jgi:hypothetical protein